MVLFLFFRYFRDNTLEKLGIIKGLFGKDGVIEN
jgi:hypothetical protein